MSGTLRGRRRAAPLNLLSPPLARAAPAFHLAPPAATPRAAPTTPLTPRLLPPTPRSPTLQGLTPRTPQATPLPATISALVATLVTTTRVTVETLTLTATAVYVVPPTPTAAAAAPAAASGGVHGGGSLPSQPQLQPPPAAVTGSPAAAASGPGGVLPTSSVPTAAATTPSTPATAAVIGTPGANGGLIAGVSGAGTCCSPAPSCAALRYLAIIHVLTGLWDASWSFVVGCRGLLHCEEEAHDGRCGEAETGQTVSTVALTPPPGGGHPFSRASLHPYTHVVSKYTFTNISKSAESRSLPASKKNRHDRQPGGPPVFFKL